MYSYGITCKNNFKFELDIQRGCSPGKSTVIDGIQTLPYNMVPMLTTIDNKLRIKISDAKHEIDKNYKNGYWDYAKTLTNPYELIFSGSKKFVGKNIKYVRNSVCDYNPLSRSFFKMIEMSNTFLLPILTKAIGINTLHLAEGPGGFIEGICHMRKKLVNNTTIPFKPEPGYWTRDPLSTVQNLDTYYGITLIDTGRRFDNGFDIPSWKKSTQFLRQNNNVIITAGYDGTGNLYHKCNIQYIKDRFANKMDIVTADGGFDFSVDYNSQEYLAGRLIFCEILSALIALKPGGTFICKFFDIINKLTVDFIYILQCKFKYIYIYKPKTSRLANSEKYIVCVDYIGELTSSELEQLFTVVDTFTSLCTSESIIENNKYIFLDGILKNVPANFTKFISNISESIIDKQVENIKTTLGLIHKQRRGGLSCTMVDEIIQKQRIDAFRWCKENNMHANIA